MIALGYELYGSPAATFNGQTVIVAQAVIWPDAFKRTATRGAASFIEAIQETTSDDRRT